MLPWKQGDLTIQWCVLFLPPSLNKRDKRGVFLYVVARYSDDFHICFSSEAQSEKSVSLCLSVCLSSVH